MGISINRTFDKDQIKSVLKDKEIWDSISEDDSDPNDFYVCLDQNIFLSVDLDGACIGIYILHVFNGSTLEIHANILPKYRKENSKESGKKMLEWFNNQAPKKYQKLIAMIPELYPHVYHFTLKRGFSDEGRITKAHKKNGKLYDIHLLGLQRKELTDKVKA